MIHVASGAAHASHLELNLLAWQANSCLVKEKGCMFRSLSNSLSCSFSNQLLSCLLCCFAMCHDHTWCRLIAVK